MCLRRYYKQPSVTFGDSSLQKEPTGQSAGLKIGTKAEALL